MRHGKVWTVVILVGSVAAAGGYPLLRGQQSRAQERPVSTGTPLAVPLPPAGAQLPEFRRPGAEAPRTPRDLSQLPALQRQMMLAGHRAADWLLRSNRQDGRFQYGWVPELRKPLEGDHYLRQVGAAYALARAARYLRDERYAAVARQAILTLLLETETDATDPHLRHTVVPPLIINRIGSAGLLVLAINELPDPGNDLLEQSEQLCAYLRTQQQPDGSLGEPPAPSPEAAGPGVVDPDGVNVYPGVALYGLMRSQSAHPAPWKLEVVRKALGYYRPRWQNHRAITPVPWQTAAFTEAFLATKEPAFKEYVFEMSDWVSGLQYDTIDARHPLWAGGFMDAADGKPLEVVPTVGTAVSAMGLANAYRAARLAGDEPRAQKYRDGVERALQFLCTLQYNEGNTQHFADWYRPMLVGGFYASHQDGTLRLDYTQHAVAALVEYLHHVAEVP